MPSFLLYRVYVYQFAIMYPPFLKIFYATQPSVEMPSHGLDYEYSVLP